MRGLLVLTVVLLAAAQVSASVKCGDIVSFQSVENGRFWRTHRSDTTAISTSVEAENNMYILLCKWKSDTDPITFGDVLYIKNLASGEYLEDGGKAEYSSAMHNHVPTTLSTVNASTTLNPMNEFTIFKVGDAAALASRALVNNGDQVAFRNRYTRFWTVPPNSNKIISQQFGSSALDKTAAFLIDGFCPLVQGKPCNRNGQCSDNRCVCDRSYRGPSCTVQNSPAFCHAIGEGHIKSFDGVFFDVHSPGEFLMYSSPEAPDREAVTMTFGKVKGTDAGDAVVPIAISVRKGGDIVTIANEGHVTVNCGADMSLPIKATAGSGFLTDADLRIYSIDQVSDYEIRSSSGLKVIVQSNATSISAWVHIFEPRLGELKGFCGDFDGSAQHEMTSEEDKKAENVVVSTYTVPATRSFHACGADSAVSFIEVSPAFAGLDSYENELTNLVVAKADIMDKHTRMALANNNLKAAKQLCQKKLSGAQERCSGLSVSSDADGLADYAACLADICTTGNSFALNMLESARQDQIEANDHFDGGDDDELLQDTNDESTTLKDDDNEDSASTDADADSAEQADDEDEAAVATESSEDSEGDDNDTNDSNQDAADDDEEEDDDEDDNKDE